MQDQCAVLLMRVLETIAKVRMQDVSFWTSPIGPARIAVDMQITPYTLPLKNLLLYLSYPYPYVLGCMVLHMQYF